MTLNFACHHNHDNCSIPFSFLPLYITEYIVFQVADGALRCFASLADRFTRRGVDPAPLAQHGLVDDLLSRLSTAGLPAPGSSMSGAPGTLTATPETKSSPSISTVISLLSTLCRGSPGVTQDLLRSKLPEAIESALQGDERLVSFELL